MKFSDLASLVIVTMLVGCAGPTTIVPIPPPESPVPPAIVHARVAPEDSTTLRGVDSNVVNWGRVATFFGVELTDMCPRMWAWDRDSTIADGWRPVTIPIPAGPPAHPRAWGERWSGGLQDSTGVWIEWENVPLAGRDAWLELGLGSAIGRIPLPPLPNDTLPPPPPPPPPGDLIELDDFAFRGAFRAPRGSCPSSCTAWGGGAALGFNPAGDGGRGSLWTNGHVYEGRLLEMSTPVPVIIPTGGDLHALPIATQLQPWADYTGGRYQTFTDGELKRYGDVLPLPTGKMLSVLFDSYGADGRDLRSICLSSTNSSAPASLGLWHVGPIPGSGDPALNSFHYSRSSGGLDLVPAWFRDAIGGYDLLCGGGWRRGGGTCGSPQGPSLVGVGLSGFAGAPGDLPAIKLMDFPKGGPAVAGFSTCRAPAGDLCSATTFEDCAFLETSDGRAAVAVLGNICPTTSHYHDPAGIAGPNDPGPCNESKGQVCDGRYRAQLWLFNPWELIEVARGTRAENDIAPYLILDLNAWLAVDSCTAGAGGLAVDHVRRVLYFSQRGVDSTASPYDKGVIVYRVDLQ